MKGRELQDSEAGMRKIGKKKKIRLGLDGKGEKTRLHYQEKKANIQKSARWARKSVGWMKYKKDGWGNNQKRDGRPSKKRLVCLVDPAQTLHCEITEGPAGGARRGEKNPVLGWGMTKEIAPHSP